MGSLGWPEILLIALVIVLLFGARKLPEIGRGLGEGIRSFRSAMRGGEDDSTKGGTKGDSGGAGK
jgi:sec-independent protein translocase protein TatA